MSSIKRYFRKSLTHSGKPGVRAVRLTNENALTVATFVGKDNVLEYRIPTTKEYDKGVRQSFKLKTIKGPRVLRHGDFLVRFPNFPIDGSVLPKGAKPYYHEVIKADVFLRNYTL